MKTFTYAEISASFPLWQQYADPAGVDSEEQFNAWTPEEKVSILVTCFGPEA